MKFLGTILGLIILWSIAAVIYGSYTTHTTLSTEKPAQPTQTSTMLPVWDEGLGFIGAPNAGLTYVRHAGRYYGADYCNTDGYGVPAGEIDLENGSNWLNDPACKL